MERLKKLIIPILFVIGVLFCYREYILGNVYFIFTGIADDSFVQTYPNLYRYAYLLEEGNTILGFDFARGYGSMQRLNAVNIFNWVILFGTNVLPYLMGISQIIKVLLSYVLFFYYLKLLNRKEITCHIGAMSYALCGHMMIRQYWSSYPNEVVLSAFVLLCLELSISKKNHIWLPVSIVLYAITLGSYKAVFVFAILIGYTVFRYFEKNRFDIKKFADTMIISVITYLIAIILGAVYILQPIIESLFSERLKTSVVKKTAINFFEITPVGTLLTGLVRTISNDWAGKNSLNVGTGNLLESPTFYCGIIMLIMVPFVICKLKGQRKIVAIVVMATATVYILFPELRRIINGFAGKTFKLSSFWIIILIIYYGTQGIDYWIDERKKINYCGLIMSVFLMIISTVIYFKNSKLDMYIYIRIMIILALFIAMMLLASKLSDKVFGIVMFTIIFSDLFLNAYGLCNTELAVSEEKISEYTDMALEEIKNINQEEFYRIEKKYDYGYQCVALVQDYYGTMDYTGGTGMNDSLHKFINQMNIPKISASSNHCLTGLSNANTLYNLLGVKYVLAKESMDNNYGLKLLGKVNGTDIYLNENVLPIGFGYEKYLSDEEFQKLDLEEKRMSILDSCVLESDIEKNKIENNSGIYNWNLQGEDVVFEYKLEDKLLTFDEVSKEKILVLKCTTIGKGQEFGNIEYGNKENVFGNVNIGVNNRSDEQYYTFSGNDISYIKFNIHNVDGIEDIELKEYNKEEYYQFVNDSIVDRKSNVFECSFFSQNKIEGNYSNNKDSVLFFSIPYDNGWNIKVNGKDSELVRVNYGFLGIHLPAGEFEIVLEYNIPYINLSVIISIIGAACLLLWFVFCTKNNKVLD